jgi:hypothetical protein
MPFLPRLLENVSRLFFGFSSVQAIGPPRPKSPATIALQVLVDQLGIAFQCFARRLEGVWITAWRASVPRVLCQQWRDIRDKDKRPE